MAGKVIGIRMGMGWPGSQSRQADAIIQNRIADGTIKFGHAVKLAAGKWKEVESGDVAEAVIGIAVREVVQSNTFDPQSNPDYVNEAPCDVMTRGNIIVKCQRGTPVAGDPVFVRIEENATYPEAVIAGFEASADGANTIEITNIVWTTGEIDADGNCEVTVLTRKS